MRRELTPKEVIYNEDFTSGIGEKESYGNEYQGVFKKIDEALSINKEGFNVYLIDEFSKQKLKDIMVHLEDKMKSRGKPKDICYVTLEDIKLMRETVGPEMGVKASGGVRSIEDAEAVIKNGATRIGASASIAICEGKVSDSTY